MNFYELEVVSSNEKKNKKNSTALTIFSIQNLNKGSLGIFQSSHDCVVEDHLKYLSLLVNVVVDDAHTPEAHLLTGVELNLAGGLATEIFGDDGGSIYSLDAWNG